MINIVISAYTIPSGYKIGNSILTKNRVRWESSNNIAPLLAKYFQSSDNSIIREYNYGHLFCIDGVPAASFITDETNLMVKRFYLNKNLLMMFDAGPLMRFTFYEKYKYLCIENSKNKLDFLII